MFVFFFLEVQWVLVLKSVQQRKLLKHGFKTIKKVFISQPATTLGIWDPCVALNLHWNELLNTKHSGLIQLNSQLESEQQKPKCKGSAFRDFPRTTNRAEFYGLNGITCARIWEGRAYIGNRFFVLQLLALFTV